MTRVTLAGMDNGPVRNALPLPLVNSTLPFLQALSAAWMALVSGGALSSAASNCRPVGVWLAFKDG